MLQRRVLSTYFHALTRMLYQEYQATSQQQGPGFTTQATSNDNPHSSLSDYIQHQAKQQVNENIRYLARLYPYLQAYIGYYIAIRKGDWTLRNSCLDKLGIMFFAYARPKYEDIVGKALVAKVMLPRPVVLMFEQGDWTVSLQGKAGANLALDEALEMCVNRYAVLGMSLQLD